jgi:hypothetical protein
LCAFLAERIAKSAEGSIIVFTTLAEESLLESHGFLFQMLLSTKRKIMKKLVMRRTKEYSA